MAYRTQNVSLQQIKLDCIEVTRELKKASYLTFSVDLYFISLFSVNYCHIFKPIQRFLAMHLYGLRKSVF